MKKSLFSCFSIFFLCSLLCFPHISFEGASNGLILWFQTVLPTLFPFMAASRLIVLSGGSIWLTKPIAPFFSRVFGLSADGTYTLLSGLLCGYPMGAKTCSDFLTERRFSYREGRFLLALCNLPSPMFLLGYLFEQGGGGLAKWRILFAVYGPLLPMSVLAWFVYKRKDVQAETTARPLPPTGSTSPATFDDLLTDCCLVMVKIGCYMILFSVLAAFFSHSSLPGICKVLAVGLMEMTTGIHLASGLLPAPVSWLYMVLFAVFGGFSGLFQTKSVIKNAGLSIRHYLMWKVLHTALSGMYFIIGLYIIRT